MLTPSPLLLLVGISLFFKCFPKSLLESPEYVTIAGKYGQIYKICALKKKKKNCKIYLILYEIVGSPPCEGSLDGNCVYSASQTQGRRFWKAKAFPDWGFLCLLQSEKQFFKDFFKLRFSSEVNWNEAYSWKVFQRGSDKGLLCNPKMWNNLRRLILLGKALEVLLNCVDYLWRLRCCVGLCSWKEGEQELGVPGGHQAEPKPTAPAWDKQTEAGEKPEEQVIRHPDSWACPSFRAFVLSWSNGLCFSVQKWLAIWRSSSLGWIKK